MPHHDDFVLVLPPEILRRYDARLLDPSSASRPRDDRPPSPTAYRGGRLLVGGLLGVSAAERIDRLQKALSEADYDVTLSPDQQDEGFGRWLLEIIESEGVVRRVEDKEQAQALRSRAMGEGWRERITSLDPGARIGRLTVKELDRGAQTRVLISASDGVTGAPDPWELLIAARAAGLTFVDLEHLVIPGGGGLYWPGQGGGLYWPGQGGGLYWPGQGGGLYWPGQGGGGQVAVAARTPVSLPLPDPAAQVPQKRPSRRPVVVVPDTGLGQHPWFPASSSTAREVETLGGLDLRRGSGEPSPEARGVADDLTGILDRLSGHGTFIAGIVRQQAPAAQIVGLPLLDSSGVAAEHDVIELLHEVLVLHEAAQAHGRTGYDESGGVVDVLNLSLGFYHQDGEVTDHPVRHLMDSYAASGVLVVAAAGNQGTRTPLYPAGWGAPSGTAAPDGKTPPLVAVGATNPDGRTVALFSNAGPWVTTHRRGANVVSTLPQTFDASGGAAVSTTVDGQVRATPDPDDLSGGFGVWSGTSFAAPWLAGELAALLDGEDLDDTSAEAMCGRARAALCSALGWV